MSAPSAANPPSADARPDLLLSAALYLVSKYGMSAARGHVCPRLAVSVQCHLELLAERPDLAPLVRETCGLLAEEWRRSLPAEEGIECRPKLFGLVKRAKL